VKTTPARCVNKYSTKSGDVTAAISPAFSVSTLAAKTSDGMAPDASGPGSAADPALMEYTATLPLAIAVVVGAQLQTIAVVGGRVVAEVIVGSCNVTVGVGRAEVAVVKIGRLIVVAQVQIFVEEGRGDFVLVETS
jgi:hypothetical protein